MMALGGILTTILAGSVCIIMPAIIMIVLIVTLRGKGNDSMAILSLVSGILGFFLLPIVGSIAAIVSGNIALNQYKELAQPNNNEGLARAGVILGWIGLGIWMLAVVGGLLFLLPVSIIRTGF
jgi:hypothetical protein